MAAFFTDLWQQIVGFFATYNWISDTLDILLVALFLYFIIRLVRDSRAEQLLRGILLLIVLYVVAYVLKLATVQFLLQAIFDNALLLLIVVFQPEVRRALEQAGNSRSGIFRIFAGFKAENSAEHIEKWNTAIEATVDGLKILQRWKMGALIVIERSTPLGEIVRSGTLVEAEPSASLIANIFYNKAPLHDGAMIIREGRIHAASCILPLTENLQISSELGTRHRAGVGMSENSDALVIILSEETGKISIADGGELIRDFEPETLAKELANRLLWDVEETEKPKKISIFRNVRKEKK